MVESMAVWGDYQTARYTRLLRARDGYLGLAFTPVTNGQGVRLPRHRHPLVAGVCVQGDEP